MHLHLRTKQPDEVEYGIIYGTIVLLTLAAARFVPAGDLLPGCAFRALAGLPCPTCGITRSLVSLAHGDLAAAFVVNPLVFLVMAGGLVLFIANLAILVLGLRRPVLSVTAGEGTVLRLSAAGLILLNWLFLVLSH